MNNSRCCLGCWKLLTDSVLFYIYLLLLGMNMITAVLFLFMFDNTLLVIRLKLVLIHLTEMTALIILLYLLHLA